MDTKKSYKKVFFISIVVLFFITLLSITLGSVKINFIDSFKILFSKIISFENIEEKYKVIIFNIRLPRIFLAGLVGLGLSVCGAIYQGMLKNNMADPYILGISSGAALGATISIILNGIIDIKIMAFITSIIITILVYLISKSTYKKDNTLLILTGINVNYFLSGVVSLIMILNKDKLDKIVFWTMGSFAVSTWNSVITVFLITVPLVILVSFFGKYLNAMALDEDTAKSVGINTEKIRLILIIITCIITSVCVSVSGIIGFAGLMIPHMVRFVIGHDYRYLIPLSGILGSVFMIICDDISRTIIAPTEIPIGIITSIVGAPYLVYLIYKKKRV